MSYINEMLAKLPSNYNGDPNGNIGKLFTLFTEQAEALKATFTDILNSRDIDQATGNALDRMGVNLKQARGSLTDDFYRVLLKTKAIGNLSKGDINTVLEVMAIIFNTPINTITLTEQYPAGLFFTVPGTVIQTSLLSNFSMVLSFIQAIMAGGVSITGGYFTGSFTLGDALSPTSDSSGLSDTSEISGGTLSGFYQ